MVTLLPINRIDPERLRQAAARWQPSFDPQPTPRIALLVGGASALFRFGPDDARQLGRQVAALARDTGGSVFVSTSRRTGAAATLELAKALPDAALFHEWSPDVAANPFLGLLALADWIVVTSDSESMIAEACSTSKPVSIHKLPQVGRTTWQRRIGEALVERAMQCRPPLADINKADINKADANKADANKADANSRLPLTLAGLCAWSIASGWILPPRDLDVLHENLIASGRAHALGEKLEPMAAEPLREVEDAAARIRTLLETR